MTDPLDFQTIDAPPPYRLLSASPEHTRDLAAHIGRLAEPCLVITLTGDLGSGKTCFVQGLAQGLEVPADQYVTSPSYTLIHTYRGRLSLHHVDLYRLSGDDIEDIGLLDLMADDAVTAIEWSERLTAGLPREHLRVDIRFVDETCRRITITAYGLGPAILLKRLPNVI
jgi:tRNA threonylcarbamoyladenosine biosynthesis protein TsaE